MVAAAIWQCGVADQLAEERRRNQVTNRLYRLSEGKTTSLLYRPDVFQWKRREEASNNTWISMEMESNANGMGSRPWSCHGEMIFCCEEFEQNQNFYLKPKGVALPSSAAVNSRKIVPKHHENKRKAKDVFR